MKNWFIRAFWVLLLAVGGFALAQSPGLFITSPIGSEQVNVRNSGPQITSIFLTQARDAVGYSSQAPSTGFSLAFTQNQSLMVVSSASTLATGTITLSPNPYDGQQNCFYTRPIVTALTLAAGAGSATINNGVTATAALSKTCYLYALAANVWERSM